MSLAMFLAEVWILIPVIFLFVVGFSIVVWNGREEGRRVMHAIGTVTKTLVLLGVCAALMFVAQSFAGYKMGIW